jgi:magnesium transporter
MDTSQKYPDEKQLNVKVITWGDLTWVDIVQPTEAAKRYLAEHYNFHPMDLEDFLSRRQLSKVDEYEQYLFAIFHIPVYDKVTKVSTKRQWSAFIGEKYLVTIRPTEFQAIDEIRRECEFSEDVKKEYFSKGAGYLLYLIMDRAIDSYFPILDKILSLMDDIEDSVFDVEKEVAKEISILRRDIITQRSVMFPERTLQVELESKLKRFTKTDMTVFFNDLKDHMNKICETLDECKEIIEVYQDADSVLSGYRANRVMRVISIMLAIGLPIGIITGLLGMDVILPGGINKGNLTPFIILSVLMIVAVAGLLVFLRRKRFI